MIAPRKALESVVMLVTIAMRLSPIERDLLAACILLMLCRLWPAIDLDHDVQADS